MISPFTDKQNKTLMDVEEELRIFMERQRKEAKKKAKEQRNYYRELQKYGLITSKKWNKPKKGLVYFLYSFIFFILYIQAAWACLDSRLYSLYCRVVSR